MTGLTAKMSSIPQWQGTLLTHFIASGMTWFALVFVPLMVFETQAASQHPATAISTLLLRMVSVL